MKTPRFQLAHRGSVELKCQRGAVSVASGHQWQRCVRLFLLQSAHILLGSSLSRDLIVAWFLAARSAAGFGGRLDMFVLAI